MNFRMRLEEFHGIVNAHREDVSNALLPPQHRQRLRVETPSSADVAKNFDVRQEAHFNRLDALTLTGVAAPACRVEREAAGGIASNARLRRALEDPANVIPESDVCRRTRAWRLADRCLVDLQHAVHVLNAADGAAADQLPRFRAIVAAIRFALARAVSVGVDQQAPKVCVQHVARYGGLA